MQVEGCFCDINECTWIVHKEKISKFGICNKDTWIKSYCYNQFHNILRLFDVLLNFPFTTSETMADCYL